MKDERDRETGRVERERVRILGERDTERPFIKGEVWIPFTVTFLLMSEGTTKQARRGIFRMARAGWHERFTRADSLASVTGYSRFLNLCNLGPTQIISNLNKR